MWPPEMPDSRCDRRSDLILLKNGHDLAVGKTCFFIEISPIQITRNSTDKHTVFSGGLPLGYSGGMLKSG